MGVLFVGLRIMGRSWKTQSARVFQVIDLKHDRELNDLINIDDREIKTEFRNQHDQLLVRLKPSVPSSRNSILSIAICHNLKT